MFSVWDGFILDQHQLIPTAKETWNGIKVVIRAVTEQAGSREFFTKNINENGYVFLWVWQIILSYLIILCMIYTMQSTEGYLVFSFFECFANVSNGYNSNTKNISKSDSAYKKLLSMFQLV